MKKLVWICWKDIQHPEAGGAELVGFEISKRLVRDGWEVVHLVPGFKECVPEEVIDGIRIIRIGRSILSFYRLPFYFWRHLRKETTFLVDTFISLGSFSALIMGAKRAALVVYHIEDIKWFTQTHFYGVPRWIMCLLTGFGYFAEKIQLGLLALLFRGPILTISNSTARELRRHGFKSERIRIITMGARCKLLGALTESLPKEKDFTVLLVGPRKSKRPLQTLEAFERLQERHPHARLWVAGWGDESEKMRQVVEERGIKNVIFWGRVTDEQRDELLQRAHVLCTSPIREGWGLVVIEANALGTPVIGYDVPGLRDSLAFGNGFLCKPTPEAMTGKMVEMADWVASGASDYPAMRQNALDSVAQFSFDHAYRDFVKILGGAG